MIMIRLFNCGRLRFFATVLLLLVTSVATNAFGFKYDGIYYYKITAASTCGVTYESSSFNSYSGDVNIPSKAYDIGYWLSVIEIGQSAFRNSTGLTSVTIPSTVKSIGDYAFRGCTGLAEITIPSSVTSIGSYAFYGCSGLTRTNVPESVTTISDYTFCNCTCLTEIDIPNALTSIGDYAFFGCASLTEINIPEKVTSIGDYAFSACTGLKKFEVAESNEYFCAKDGVLYSKDMTVLVAFPCGSSLLPAFSVPESVTTISAGAFYGCTGLTSVTIPSSVTKIGAGAFRDCTGLISLTIPNSVTSIGDYAFYNCTGLTEVNFNATACTSAGSSSSPVFSGSGNKATLNIGNNVTRLYRYLFSDFTGLAKVVIGNSVTEIEDCAFSGCTSLTSVSISNSVTAIDIYAFQGCTDLTEIAIPNNVTVVGSYAFKGCTSLKDATIGYRVEKINNNAFDGCAALRSITSLNPEPPLCKDETVFKDVRKNLCTVYVPEGSYKYYAYDDVWGEFYFIEEIDVSPVSGIAADGNAEPVGYYTTDGKQVPTLQRGINIIRYSDGTAKKVLVR